jgi:hypothetical protein
MLVIIILEDSKANFKHEILVFELAVMIEPTVNSLKYSRDY